MSHIIINLSSNNNGDNWQNAISFYNDWQNGKKQFELSTSGSTGNPKPIFISKTQMEVSANQTINALNLTPSNNLLVCIKTKFIGGKMMLVRGIINNMPLYIVEPSSNPIKSLTQHIDFMAVVPLQMQTMLNDGEHTKLNKMKAIIVGGAPINQQLKIQIEKLKVPVYATYGMTETISHIALKKLNGSDKSNYFTSLGDIKISKDDRNCLTVTGSVTNHATIATNDVVELINSNQFEWLGRYDNIINSGGIKVNPEKIEEIIEQIFLEANIQQRFFIHGIEDKLLGKKVALIIEGEKFDTAPLQQILLQQLEKYSYPKSIIFISQFIETETGKIKRIETILNSL